MIKLEDISKKYGNREIFSHFSVEFEEHKVSCILGASGVGKTTLINIIAGMVSPNSGRVSVTSDGKSGGFRGSYVFQEARLLPWLNVHDNLDLVLKNVKKPSDGQSESADHLSVKKSGFAKNKVSQSNSVNFTKEERNELIKKQLELVGLSDYEFSPLSELSGGMVQRVALCRAFLYPSDILFLDEPFKEQDTKLKDELYETFFRAYENDAVQRTVLFVTHDISEALRLADTIYVLAGAPAEIAGKFEKAEFTEGITERIKALI